MAAHRVLGISLGTRKMGVAVLKRTSIFDCRMKTFNEVWSEKKLQAIIRIVEKHITKYRPTEVTIKVPSITLEDLTVSELLCEIEKLLEARAIPLHSYTLADLKMGWCRNYRANKKQLMKCILEKYPELRAMYDKEMQGRVKYYEKLFEAVAVAALRIE